MKNKRIILTIILLIIPFIGYYLIRKLGLEFNLNLNMEYVVGLVAILSGITGIVMSITSSRQASLDAIKEYYQQGDSENYVKARGFISSKNNLKGIDDQKQVSDIVNFYELWGLLNSKKYLPIWVFGGVSGIRVVEMYIRLTNLIMSVRDGTIDSSGKKPINPFYGKQFEELAYRIYRKYKKNFDLTNFEEKFAEAFEEFKLQANKKKGIF